MRSLFTLFFLSFAISIHCQTIDYSNGDISGFRRLVTVPGSWMDLQLEGTGSTFKIHDNTNSRNWVKWTAGSTYSEFLSDLYVNSSNIGIGVENPDFKIDIQENKLGMEDFLRLRTTGEDYFKVTNMTNASANFIPGLYGYHISDNREALYMIGAIESANDVGGEPLIAFDARLSKGSVSNRPLFAWDSYASTKMILLANGNLGIGTKNPDEKLTVNGMIHAKEVRIDLDVPAPDYVFENDYHLRSLEEVEGYVSQNKHLPGIPSAASMEASGVSLLKMSMLLLKKIEELTLYQIEMQKRLKVLEKQSK